VGRRDALMRITLKLFASLAAHLPPEARDRHRVDLDVPPGATVLEVIRQQRIPETLCAIVLVDGHWVGRTEREGRALREGEVLSIWPPVAGGAPSFSRTLEMSIARSEFLRLLPNAVGRFDVDGQSVSWPNGTRGTIRLIPLPGRLLGGVIVPRHSVEITLDECAEAEGEAFMARFHRAFLRGGG
jgi:sulfur-carrier protein